MFECGIAETDRPRREYPSIVDTANLASLPNLFRLLLMINKIIPYFEVNDPRAQEVKLNRLIRNCRLWESKALRSTST